MSRRFGMTFLLVTVLGLTTFGCSREPQVPSTECQLVMILPESKEAPDYAPSRVTKLTVDGKEVPVKAGATREVLHKLDAGAGKTVTIVYDHWPYTYSNTIRTKEAKLANGKQVRIDFKVPDADRPDKILPIFVPTPYGVVDKMCEFAQVGKDDVVFDIGCGDGRLVIVGVKKFGARKGVGVDIDAELVKKCRENAETEGVADKVEFRNEDALTLKDWSEATVVLLYVGEDFGKALEPVLRKTLKPGARIVSHRFPLGDWRPDDTKDIKAKNNDGEDAEYHLKLWTIK